MLSDVLSSPRTATRTVAAGLILLAACSADRMMQRFVPADADARARTYLALFTRHQADSAEARIAPSLAGPDAHRALQQIDSLLGGQRFDSVRVIGAQVNQMSGVRRANLSYEIRAPMGWLGANVATVDSAGTWFVEGVSVTPIPRPIEAETDFTLRGKSALHYLWLVLMVASAICSLGTALFIAFRSGMPKRWRWALAAALGVGAFSMNWATGETAFRIVKVQVFSAAALRAGPVAPWILTFAFPLGAMLALRRYRRWRTLDAEPAPVPPGPDATISSL